MVEYTVGFMFSEDESEVVLLQKKKKKGLEFLAGRWNGVGGTVEENELPSVCMAREFEEEAGIHTDPKDWKIYAIIVGPNYNVNFYVTHYHNLYEFKQCESEKVSVFGVSNQLEHGKYRDDETGAYYADIDVVPNLRYLIPLALNAKHLATPVWIFYND